jgi:hypothetical protein
MTQDTNGQGQYSGQGGSYVIDAAGDHVLVERTREPGDDPAPADPPAPAAAQDQPTSVGIFSPDASADQPTTTE